MTTKTTGETNRIIMMMNGLLPRQKTTKATGVFLVLVLLTVLRSTVFGWQPTTINNNNNRSRSRSRITSSKSSSSMIEDHHHIVSRRTALVGAVTAALPFMVMIGGEGTSPVYAAEEESDASIYNFANRNRNSNKDAIIREDYWFMMGKTPPRKLPPGALAQADDPQWNAFGSCQTQSGDGATSNSCTYVSLKQRIPTYSKYGFTIALGAKEYTQLGRVLKEAVEISSSSSSSSSSASVPASVWNTASSYVFTPDDGSSQQQLPPPTIDALVKMVLFASGMLTSPNFSGPNKRLLVARYYANETSYAVREIQNSIQLKDPRRAYEAWLYGKDSFNSWIECVNDSVSSKVGDKFEYIS